MKRAIRVITIVAMTAATVAAPPATDPASAAFVAFTAGELLGKPTDTSITVNVVPSQTVDLWVQYGTSPGNYSQTTSVLNNAPGGQGSEITISGLSPNTRYFYRVQYDSGDGIPMNRPEGTFHTQRAPGEGFTFVLQSDAHIEGPVSVSSAVYNSTVGNMVDDEPDFLIDLGDMFQVTGGQAAVDGNYIDQREFLEPLSRNAATFLTVGNHENEEGWWRTGPSPDTPIWSINARKEFFANPVPDGFYTGDTSTHTGLGVSGDGLRETYYAWEWGDALFVVLDPFWNTMTRPHNQDQGADPVTTPVGDRWDWTLGQDQYDWLEDTLSSSDQPLKFVFIHHLTGGTNPYGRGGVRAINPDFQPQGYEWGEDDNTVFEANRPGWGGESIHEILVANRVDAVFHGHDHCFSREQYQGVVYQEVPMPSASGGGSGLCSGSYGPILDNSGHLRVQVLPNAVAAVLYIRGSTTGANGTIVTSYGVNPGPSAYAALPPTAEAGEDQIVFDDDGNGFEPISLDGSESWDVNGPIVEYTWSEGSTELANGVSPTVDLPVGVHEITLEVRDNGNLTDRDTLTVTVKGPPVANAGPDQLVVDANDDGIQQVSLDGTSSSDPDNAIVSYVWSRNGSQIATGSSPNVNLGLGTHEISLEVTDEDAQSDTDTVEVKVISPPLMPDPPGGEITAEARYGNSVILDGFAGAVDVAFSSPGAGATCPQWSTTPPGGNNGCDLQPGWTATAIGSGGPTEVVIADLGITGFDTVAETVTVQISDPGGELSYGCDGTVAIAYGADVDDVATATRKVPAANATIDFSVPGPCPGNFDNTTANVTYNDAVYLTGWEPDGDRTLETRPVQDPFECPTDPAPFGDVDPSSFAYDDINCIWGLDITTGTSATAYSPNALVTREQMAAFIARVARLMGTDIPSASHPFTDVPVTSFAYDDIALIYRLGVTTGTSATTYSPNALVTREQMAAFIARLYSILFGTPRSPVLAWVAPHPFTDIDPTSFARDDIARIYGLGITTGTTPTTYSPNAPVTREQMAAFIARLLRILQSG